MEDYYRRNYIPAFGNWDWNDNLPFTQCFESSRNGPGFLAGYGAFSEDNDLYVAGDLYENNVVTPAMIVVPRSRTKRHRHVKEGKKENWVNDVLKETTRSSPDRSSSTAAITMRATTTPKPVDEDLYKISPDLLYSKPKKKRGLSYITSCLLPTCFL